jgi:hypothetical protein
LSEVATSPDTPSSPGINASAFGVMPEPVQEGAQGDQPEVSSPRGIDTADTGKIVVGDGNTDSPQVSNQPTSKELSDPSSPGPAPEKFKFFDREWDNPQAAEHHFKSWEGRLSAASKREAELVTQLNSYWKYVQDAEAALNNKAAREAKPDSVPEKSGPKRFSEAVDWEQLRTVQEMAKNSGYDPAEVGNRFLAEQMDNYIEEKLKTLEESVSAPVRSMQDAQNLNMLTNETFLFARDLRNEDDTFQYPELGGGGADKVNEPFVRNMYAAWNALAQSYPEFAFTAAGVDYAYALAQRSISAGLSTPAAVEDTTVSATTTLARDEKGRFITATKAQAQTANPDSAPSNPGVEEDENDNSVDADFRRFSRYAARPVKTAKGLSLGFTD